MRINIVGRGIEVTKAMDTEINKKLSKLSTFLDENDNVNVIVRVVKRDQIIEVTVFQKKNKPVRAEARDEFLYNALDEVQSNLLRQLRKRKEKVVSKKLRAANEFAEKARRVEEDEGEIFREKEVALIPITRDDAKSELCELGHDFHLFLDSEHDNAPSVIYKRHDGGFGIVAAKE